MICLLSPLRLFLLIFLSWVSFSLLGQQEETVLLKTTSSEAELKTSSKAGSNNRLISEILHDLEAQFNIHFLYESEILAFKKVAGFNIKAKRTPEQNLDQLLKDSDLKFLKVSDATFVLVRKKKKGTIYGTVMEKSGIPLNGATLRLTGQNTGTVTDLDGQFQMELMPGDQELEVSYVGFNAVTQKVEIPSGDSILAQFYLTDRSTLEQVVIVGNRFSSSSLLKSSEPADVINQKELRQKPQFETGQLLQYTIPSFHSTAQTISDGTDHIDPASLRGLGPDQLLVLINGKRRHPSSLVNINGTVGKGTVATDLNAIPASAIERIEVLRDGAAVEYGSDAIAGVINIILKENIHFIDVNATTGITNQGDGEVFQLNGNFGFPLGDQGGYINLTTDFTKRGSVNRSGNYTGIVFGDKRDHQADSLDRFFSQTGYQNQQVMSIGSAASNSASLFINAALPVGANAEMYTFGGASYRRGQANGFYRFPYQKTRQSGLFPLGFSPVLQTDIFDRAITIGFRGLDIPWQIDLSNTTGGNSFNFIVHNSNNASMGLASPSTAKAGGFSYLQNVTNLDICKDIEWHIPFALGFGSEFRLENYQQRAGEEAAWKDYESFTLSGMKKEGGFQMFPGFKPENEVDEYRHNLGIYATLKATIRPSLTLNTAGRYEYYSDFGSHFIWKIGTRYTINEFLTFRGSFNTGFRAPSVPQIYFSNKAFQFLSVGNEQTGMNVAHYNNQSSITRQFGITPLKPEYSQNAGLGVALRILKNLSITADVYQINIRDRIVITGRFSAEDDPHFAAILEPTGVSEAQFFTNAIDTRTRGLDASLKYFLQLHKAKLLFSWVSNFNKTRLRRDAEGNPVIRSSQLLAGFEDILFNREEISRIEVARPGSKSIFTFILETKKIEAQLIATRFGKVEYIHPDDGDPDNWVFNELSGQVATRDQLFSSKWVTNLSVLYRFSNHFSLSLGANNLFNVYPDQHQHAANISNGLFVYSRRVQQFGVRGAFWYTRINFRF